MLLILFACAEPTAPVAPSPAPATPAAAPAAAPAAPASPAAAPTKGPTLNPLRGWPEGFPMTWTRLTDHGGTWVVEKPCKGEPDGLQFGDDVFYRLGPDGPTDLGSVIGVLVKQDTVTVRYQAPEGIHEVAIRWGDPGHTWLQEGERRFAPTESVGTQWKVEPAPGC